MEAQHHPSVRLHFRFKFLAITSLAFLLYIILSSGAELSQFSQSFQFRLMGPFFLAAAGAFLLFRKVPVRCPHCSQSHPVKYDWACNQCGKTQAKERCLADKCTHCGALQADTACTHCGKIFSL